MRKTIYALAITLFVLANSQNTYAQSIGLKTLPKLTFKNLDNKKVDLDQSIKENQLTVVSFWATWCGPCLQELSAVSDLYEDWKEDYGVEFLAVSTDNSRNLTKVKAMANGKDWPFPVLTDPEGTAQSKLNFPAVPFMLIVNQKGEVLYKHNGYAPGFEEELEEKIKSFAL
ncbi:hypothetical protein FUAX_31350 [Fulvitalea axinellae]|uniref:Thioredoxin domain-containing protein n=1 Tax=Fulvitalea axinellae TaxID=1182444 RepID=A0AAU9D431_9BACT|nr:hypothetical protein FUAX_31350 [Fulvitalea axinellae]